ncbi:MAG: hypothetical protein WAZ60_24015 [Desulfosalsimonadaceae bacterium]
MKKNTAVIVTITAWDTILNVGKTGDAANITVRGVGDGAEFTPSAPAVTEVDAVNLPGVYTVSYTAAENNYNSNSVGGKSSTANVSIFGLSWINESEDFSATEKASIAAAVPGVAAIQSGLALDGTVAKEATLATVAGYLDTEIAGIKAKTDTLGGSGAITWPFQVTDSSGNPVTGAEVHVTGPSGETADGVTDASGYVNPAFTLNAGVNTFRVSANGKNIGTKQETVA